MRHPIAIVLIFCGTLLVLAPPASDYLREREATLLLRERSDFTQVRLATDALSTEYRFGCWALGAAMIAVGIYGAWPREVAAQDGRPGAAD